MTIREPLIRTREDDEEAAFKAASRDILRYEKRTGTERKTSLPSTEVNKKNLLKHFPLPCLYQLLNLLKKICWNVAV